MTKMALLQFDPTVGDLEQNCRRLGALAAQAASCLLYTSDAADEE